MQTPARAHILEAFEFYRNADPPLQAAIAAGSRLARLEPATVLFREGERCRYAIAVGSGEVHTFRIAASGREITLFHVGDGQMGPVNTVSVLFDRPAVASARVDVPTTAVLIPARLVRDAASASPALRGALMETVATGLADVMTLVESVAFRSMDSRLADLLLHRFAQRRVISATHEDIAAELGTAREVVSRLLKGYERSGAIQIFRGRLELRDESRLRRLA